MSDPQLYRQKELLPQIAMGDEDAFAELYMLYSDQLKSFLISIVKSSVIAEDILQEVFVKLWLHREKIAGYEQPKAWVYRLAIHAASKHLRDALRLLQRHERANAQTATIDEDPVTRFIENKETSAILEAAISELSEKRQQVFRLHRQQGLTYKQIAEQMSISPETVKSHLQEATRFLRQRLDRDMRLVVGIFVFLSS